MGCLRVPWERRPRQAGKTSALHLHTGAGSKARAASGIPIVSSLDRSNKGSGCRVRRGVIASLMKRRWGHNPSDWVRHSRIIATQWQHTRQYH
jgi:hypothetical protein